MKKIFFLSFVFVTVLSLVACDFNAPLRDKMLNYYSDDSNYETVEGTVVSVEEGTLRIDITTEDH